MKKYKKKFNVLKLLRSLLIIAIVIFLGLRLFVNFILTDNLTYKAKYDELNLESTYSGVIFRKEEIINTNASGAIKYFVNEGEKIKKGYKVAEITHEKVEEDIVSEKSESDLIEFQKKIKIDISVIDGEIDSLKQRILESVDEKNYVQLSDLKNKLLLKLDKRSLIEKNKKLIDNGSSSFKESYIGNANANVGDKVNFYSPISGIVSFYIDNLEPNLTIENIYNINYSELMDRDFSLKSLTSSRLAAKSPVYKIVDNSLWFLVCVIDKKDLNFYDKNQKIVAMIDSNKLDARVADVFVSSDKAALVLKISQQYEDFYKKRFVKATIIRNNFNGIKIKNTSIVSKNNVLGVYILGINNKANFRPIKILGKDDKYSIVKDGYIYIDDENKRVRTIDLTDEIVIDAASVKEGDKIY
ncbi:HlyD family efflux transporter periplasmic adaptor subunit [Helicovermis profundi]|uniref:Membrane fusion protein n=1 Tax=Helicovermis profundi TaxID=3065157 RepID=A0AAU9EC19_9FIRM|nr:hypothetical protein HLPR_18180 [Clostridia bacterium S502]